jgi:ribulose-phosphate 3-epimerase
MTDDMLITASILSADLGKLNEEVSSIEPYADWMQIDVMDGHFVPNLSFGAPILKNLKTHLPLDIHLMVTNPAERIDEFVDAGAYNITFHAEAVPETDDQKKLIELIRSKGCKAGIAFNPDTPIPYPLSPIPDLILCMTVVPGFSGQTFHEEVLPKINDLRALHPDLMIQVDGGIDAATGKKCREAGANNLVSASYIFGSKNRKAAIEALRE